MQNQYGTKDVPMDIKCVICSFVCRFVWIMGVCIPLSISSQLAKNVSRTRLLGHVIKVRK